MTTMSRPARRRSRPSSRSPPGGRADDVSTVPERGHGSPDRAESTVSSASFICAGPVPERRVWPCPNRRPNLALDAVVQSLIVANVGELVGELAEMACPDCGIKFMEFRAGGRLGCPAGLLGLLRRACCRCCSGTTARPGTSARWPGGARAPCERLRLRTRLREAIAREDYEEAARLRDLLRPKDPHA